MVGFVIIQVYVAELGLREKGGRSRRKNIIMTVKQLALRSLHVGEMERAANVF